MLETVLHTGAEHPNLVWVVLAGVFSFIAGLGIGSFSDRVRSLGPDRNTVDE